MKICAVELINNEANLCLMEKKQGLISVPDCRARKLTLSNPLNTDSVRDFKKQFAKLMEDYQVTHIVIRERPMKGKFAGSTVSFKIEALLQTIDDIECDILSSTDIKESLKKTPLQVSLKEVGLKQFQEQAFQLAFAFLNR